MNKTFLLVTHASYTEGSMLIVIDSIEEFISLFKEYHAKKKDFMLANAGDWYDLKTRQTVHGQAWNDLCERKKKFEELFIKTNDYKPFCFEHLVTGCKCDGSWFYTDFIISNDPEKEGWNIAKEFLSDLPRGTHYCGDYTA